MWKPWSLPRQHVAPTTDGRMWCLFTAGEEPLGTGEGQGWGEGKRCWGFPLISMDGWRLERACQWYLYSGISSLMGTAVLGSVDLCMGQCIRESSKGGWANSGSPVHSAGRAVLVLPSPAPVVVMVPPQPACPSTHRPPLPRCKLPSLIQVGPGGWTDPQQHGDFISYTNS